MLCIPGAPLEPCPAACVASPLTPPCLALRPPPTPLGPGGGAPDARLGPPDAQLAPRCLSCPASPLMPPCLSVPPTPPNITTTHPSTRAPTHPSTRAPTHPHEHPPTHPPTHPPHPPTHPPHPSTQPTHLHHRPPPPPNPNPLRSGGGAPGARAGPTGAAGRRHARRGGTPWRAPRLCRRRAGRARRGGLPVPPHAARAGGLAEGATRLCGWGGLGRGSDARRGVRPCMCLVVCTCLVPRPCATP